MDTDITARIDTILSELREGLAGIDYRQLLIAADSVTKASRIFIAGAGRSGLTARMFAMRLAQADLTVHFVGDSTATAINNKDLLIVASGSGNTAGMIMLAEEAKKSDAKLLLITRAPQSRLGEIADDSIFIPVPLDDKRPGGLAGTQMLGSRFETSLLVTCDLLVEYVCERLGETTQNLQSRHANLE